MVGTVFGLLFGFLPLMLIGLVVAGIVLVRRAHEDGTDDPGIGAVRRFFLYGVALVALAFMASGAALLVAATVDALRDVAIVGTRDERFPLGLAFLIVGAPVWAGTWFISARVIEQHPVERRALLRWLYLLVVRGIALAIIVVTAINVAGQIVGAQEVSGTSWGWLTAWGIVWAFHQRMVALDPAPTEATRSIDRFYRAFGSAIGLGVLAVSLGMLVSGLLDFVYDALVLPGLVGDDAGELWLAARMPAVAALVGAATWSWHWLRGLRAEVESTLWLVYVFLFGILSGTAVTLIAAAVLVYNVLEWLVGVPRAATATAHFEFLPGVTAALLVGAALWGYHRMVQRELLAGRAERTEPERIYRYLVAAAGLLTFAAGIATLLATAIDVVATDPADVVRDDAWWRNQLVLAVTFIAVGAPVWARYWFDAQRHASLPGERAAQSRRVFIFGIFGLATLVALGSLVHVLYTFFDSAFEGTLGTLTIHETRVSLAIVVTAGIVSVYYWLVLREDQRTQALIAPAEAEAAPPPPRDVLLFAPGDASALAAVLRSRLGTRVRVERRLDGPDGTVPLTDEQVEALVAAIVRSGSARVVVLLAPDGAAQVAPYR